MWAAKQKGYAIGLMSGTSGDGIDAALVHFEEREDSEFPRMTFVESYYRPYSEAEREHVFALFDPNVSATYTAHMHVQMGHWFADAVEGLMAKSGVSNSDVVVIGSHGQTVCHHPERHMTLQIGDPTCIALRTGCGVVSDFRRQDMTVGGQGAPLIPYFDFGYVRSAHATRVALNIGGIANVTVLPARGSIEHVIAFDTGPGNMVLDGAAQQLTGGALRCDEHGALAAQGNVHAHWLRAWLDADDYVRQAPPKSTGRERYGADYVQARLEDTKHLSVEDQLATLTAFVAEAIAIGIRASVQDTCELLISGGGRHNPTLVKGIVERVSPSRVIDSESIGIPSDMKEAMAFALFAWQFTHGRKTNVPSATDAHRHVRLGQWTPGA